MVNNRIFDVKSCYFSCFYTHYDNKSLFSTKILAFILRALIHVTIEGYNLFH